jgi:hypothetical protein
MSAKFLAGEQKEFYLVIEFITLQKNITRSRKTFFCQEQQGTREFRLSCVDF